MPQRNGKQKKLQQIEDQDGWTHVVRGPRLASNELTRRKNPDSKHGLSEHRRPAGLSLSEVRSKYLKTKELWAKEPLRHKFEEAITTQITSNSQLQVENVIVLGLGSLAADNLDSSSMHQLVLFEHWIAFLRNSLTIPIIYFQDPHFCETDHVFLTGLGYTIIEDPEAYLLVHSRTFLFAPYLPWEVIHTFLYAAYPILFVSNGSHTKEAIFQPERLEILGHSGVKSFYASRSSTSLAENVRDGLAKHSQWLQDMVLYVPKDYVGNIETKDVQLPGFSPKRSVPLVQTVQDEHSGTHARTGRVGPGQWHRTDGFVFDAEFQHKLDQVRAERDARSSSITLPD